MNQNMYLLGPYGEIRFTKEGVERLLPLFDMAGISLADIKTVGDYLRARKQASPFFMKHLSDRASTWPETDQFRLLKTAVFESEVQLERETHQFDMKKRLKIIK